jgi:hypothetical protein
MPDNRLYRSDGTKKTGSILKWVLIAVAVLVMAYLAFFFFVGKAVVGTVTG